VAIVCSLPNLDRFHMDSQGLSIIDLWEVHVI
jgi:hypothetical protein